MPYKVVKLRGDRRPVYAVVNADTGRRYGVHSTKIQAERQKRALYASESKRQRS